MFHSLFLGIRPTHLSCYQTPEQPNSCDCGVYVGQVVETIFKSPAEFWQLTFVSTAIRQYYKLVTNSSQSKAQKNRLTESHFLWNVERFKEKRDELHNLITKLSEQWKGIRSKIAPAPLPKSSTPPAEISTKEDKDTPPSTPSKRKAGYTDPMEVADEDEVVILEVPAAKRQQKSPRKKVGSSPRKSTGRVALRFTGPRR